MPDLLPNQLPPRDARKDLADRLGSLIRDVRDRRQTLEQRWLWNHAAWRGIRLEERQGYKNDTYQHYLPAARRAVERTVVRATQMLLPQPVFFEVYPGDEFDLNSGRSADAVRAYMTYLVTQRLNIRRTVQELVRSLLLYQRAITKTTVKLFGNEIWPTLRAVDPFNFYVWPETVTDMDDAVLVFEDVMLPWSEYDRAARDGLTEPLKRAELSEPEWPHHVTTRLAHSGMANPSSVRAAHAEDTSSDTRKPQGPRPQPFVALSEVYFKSGAGQWMVAWLVWNVAEAPRVVRVRPSSYPHPPYREALARPLAGEHYTSGMMDDLEPLQLLLNDQINQGEASRAIAAEPPVALDENEAPRRDLLVYKPRAFWPVSNQAVTPIAVVDTSANSQRAAQLTLGFMNAISGSSGMAEGAPTRGLPRAGFAVSQLLSLGIADTKDIAEVIEYELLTHGLSDLHRLTVRFVPPSQVFRIPGTADYPARQVRSEEIEGNWNFRWVGSQQSQDQQMRSQRLAAFVQQLAQVEPRLMQQGYQINWPPLVKMAWRDGLGERGVEQIVVPAQQPMMSPEMSGEGGGQPGGMPANTEELGRAMSGLMSAGMAEGEMG